MLRLMTPCRPHDEAQLKAKISLLRKHVKDEYPIGLEIGISMNDFYNPSMLEKAVVNLRKLEEPMFLSFHGPIELEKGSRRNFFQSEEGFENLLKTFQFAEEIGANLVNIHAHLFVSYEELAKMGQDEIERYRMTSIQKVKKVLERARKQVPFQKICIENVPYCLTVDRVINPEETIYELCFVDLADFQEIVRPKKNIFATIDTSHFAQVFDSSQLLSKIKGLGKGLGHIHLSDTGNVWQPFINLVEEGVVPGEGRIGERIFKELLRYFLKFSEKQDLSVVIEVDDKDFVKLEESKESFRRVTKCLKELKEE